MLTSTPPSLILYTSNGEQEFWLEGYHDLKIGRSDDNDIIILDQWVSRHHAIIKRVDQQKYSLIDLGTRNGSFLNGKMINLPTILHHGDIIRLGQTQLRFNAPISTFTEYTHTSFETSSSLETSISIDEELVEKVLPPLVSIMVIHLENLDELAQDLPVQIKYQILEDLYYKLQKLFHNLEGYTYAYHEKYLIGLWVHNSAENQGFEGIKMLNLLTDFQPVIPEIQKQYYLEKNLKFQILLHTDIYQNLEPKSKEKTITIQDLLQEKYIKNSLFLLEEIKSLEIQISWSQNAYDHLVYFPELQKKLTCYLIDTAPQEQSIKIYGIQGHLFKQISFINPALSFIKSIAAEIFATILNTKIGLPIAYDSFDLEPQAERYQKLRIHLQTLKIFQVKLEPEIESDLEFILGLTEGGNNKTQQHFERSLSLLKAQDNLVRKACINYCLAYYWYGVAWSYLFEDQNSLQQAKFYFSECIDYFEQITREDRIAKMIHLLAEVLKELKDWSALEQLFKKALPLHRTYSAVLQNAQDLASLAEIKYAQGEYDKAEKFMKKAFLILVEQQNLMGKNFTEVQGWYLLIISKIQIHLNQGEEAIKNLARAKICLENSQHIARKIELLNQLSCYYHQQQDLVKALKIKKEKYILEQQYQKRYFVEFGTWQKRQVLIPKQFISNHYYQLNLQEKMTENILLSGRKNESNYIMSKINLSRHKIFVLYGENGQGKTSFLELGILPILEYHNPHFSWSHLVINNYHQWMDNIANFFFDILRKQQTVTIFKPSSINQIKELKKLAEEVNLELNNKTQVWLIFDQVERFFSSAIALYQSDLADFINHLLELNNFKLIFSIQSAYLPSLLSLNNLIKVDQYSHKHLFDVKDFYQLPALNSEEIEAGWQILYHQFNFPFAPDLIKVVVQDLSQVNLELKPIDLQIMMASLEKQEIFTLESYYQYLGNNQLSRWTKILESFLNYVWEYCGTEYDELAKLILYLLTEKYKNNYTAKSVRELSKDLKLHNFSYKKKQIQLVLEILVESNLVTRFLTPWDLQYQLLHPFLIPYIRRHYNLTQN